MLSICTGYNNTKVHSLVKRKGLDILVHWAKEIQVTGHDFLDFNIAALRPTIGNFYKINVGGDTRKIPKDRIHKANGIERPADYDQKFKLFMKKYPVDAAANYITQHVARNHSSGGSEMLNSQLPDILKKFNISDQKDIDKLRTALKYQSVVLVDQYNTKRQDDDDDDDF